MHTDNLSRIAAVSRNVEAREIHELAYLRQLTGASEAQIRTAIARVGSNRAKVERELVREAADQF